MMNKYTILAIVVASAFAGLMGAQQAQSQSQQQAQIQQQLPQLQQQQQDPMEAFLYPPELIMRFNQQLNLDSDQRTAITTAIQHLQSEMVDLQWTMMEASQDLDDLIRMSNVDESAATDAMKAVVNAEGEIKYLHFSTLVRIKNTLTQEQQELLQNLRYGRSEHPDEGLR